MFTFKKYIYIYILLPAETKIVDLSFPGTVTGKKRVRRKWDLYVNIVIIF